MARLEGRDLEREWPARTPRAAGGLGGGGAARRPLPAGDQGDGGPDPRSAEQPIARATEPLLEASHVDRLRGHFLRFVEEGGRTNLQRWAAAAEFTTARAGLLLSDDLAAAATMLAAEGAADLPARMDDLVVFSASPAPWMARGARGASAATTRVSSVTARACLGWMLGPFTSSRAGTPPSTNRVEARASSVAPLKARRRTASRNRRCATNSCSRRSPWSPRRLPPGRR